ncbi:MAG: prepilin-type N-terminal cleavage/methylation domain-containing protein [Lentisphaerae bacterium]|nr:prepilin-type N-terminal cleavage/methylation domain-containing protein [Lentisphaerota bacterium]
MKISHFTLIELIVAMAILALVGLASSAALFGYHRSHGKVASLSQKLERNRKLDKVADLMSNMIPFYWRNEVEDGGQTLVFDGREDELYFTAMRLPDSEGRGAFIFVHLYVDEENQLVCDYKDTPLLPWEEDDEGRDEGVKTAVLAEKVAALTFIYGEYNEDDQVDWLEVWDQEDDEYLDRMPVAVGFTVEFESGEKLSYMRRTAGISAFSGLAQ